MTKTRSKLSGGADNGAALEGGALEGAARNCATVLFGLLLLLLAAASTSAQEAERTDYLTFAQGALAVSLGGDAEALKLGFGDALEIIDGNPLGKLLGLRPITRGMAVEIVYELPALTTFDRFAVPGVFETPSPSQTFVKNVEIFGAADAVDGTFASLASAELATHEKKGMVTELVLGEPRAVRWVKVRLSGGIDVRTEKYFLEFTELIGNGKQESVPLVEEFHGTWKYRANVLELKQEGPTVVGCYDRTGELEGTVSGNVLRATGVDLQNGVKSTFILMLDRQDEIQGVRSTNGAPFQHYVLPIAPEGTKTRCSAKEPASLGCGDIVHGVQFDFDSANIRPESEPVLANLFAGLGQEKALSIVVVGHTSSEGSEAYNQDLSERRASAVVEDLVRRGLDKGRISADGRGESEPIASNDDEAGRSLNRRVEIRCSGS